MWGLEALSSVGSVRKVVITRHATPRHLPSTRVDWARRGLHRRGTGKARGTMKMTSVPQFATLAFPLLGGNAVPAFLTQDRLKTLSGKKL